MAILSSSLTHQSAAPWWLPVIGAALGCAGRSHSRAARVLALLLTFAAGMREARSQTAQEYDLKAAFLFNFVQFVEWPDNAFETTNSPVVIGILGDDPFGSVLDTLVKGETVFNREIVVRRYSRSEDVGACHVLFVSRSERARVNRVLAGQKNKSVLTVSDLDGFATKGGVVGFFSESGRIRFRINVEAARQARLTISSKLLRLAEIVETDRNN